MTNIPTHIEDFDAIPRDMTINDRSRLRGETPALVRKESERVTDLGNGLTLITYVDHLTAPTGV